MTNYNNREKRDYVPVYMGIVMLVAMGMLAASAYVTYQNKIEKAQKFQKENLEQIVETRK